MSNDVSTTTIRLNDDELTLVRLALSLYGSKEFEKYSDQERDEDVRNAAHGRWSRAIDLGSKVANAHEALTARRDLARLIDCIAYGETRYFLGFGDFYEVRLAYLGSSVAAELIGSEWKDGAHEKVVVKRFVESDGEKLAKAIIKFAKSN